MIDWRGFVLCFCLGFMSLGVNAKEIVPAKEALELSANSDVGLMVNNRVFKLDELLAMPAWETDIKTVWNASGKFRGVLLTDLLAAADIEDFKRLSLVANNDYKVSLNADQPDLDTAVIAYSLDGKLLDPIEKGPFWLIWPPHAEKLVSGEAPGDLWIWGLVNIRLVR